LKEQYRVPVADGRRMLARIDASAHGQAVRALHEHIEDEAVRTNAVTTPFGEAVDFYSFEVRGDRRAPRNPREAYACAQQGTAALIMQSMVGPVDAIARECGGRLLLIIHDEFVVCADAKKIDGATRQIRDKMTSEIPQMPVPFDDNRGLRIPVDFGVGPSWGECENA
jgi:DNA polymerase I-like protein with 3'-5' exonuclease and polymerase domains